MADNTISPRTLTYRDPTVSAAAEAQLRRARQQSFESLVNQAQQTSGAAARASQTERDKSNYQSAQDAAEQADQTMVAEEDPTTRRQAKRQALNATNSASSRQRAVDEDDDQEQTQEGKAETAPAAVPFKAQQIAQEHLGIGLHVPALQPADEAYRKAGAEPPLPTEEVNPSLFALAI